jgi:hypothetical protein
MKTNDTRKQNKEGRLSAALRENLRKRKQLATAQKNAPDSQKDENMEAFYKAK